MYEHHGPSSDKYFGSSANCIKQKNRNTRLMLTAETNVYHRVSGTTEGLAFIRIIKTTTMYMFPGVMWASILWCIDVITSQLQSSSSVTMQPHVTVTVEHNELIYVTNERFLSFGLAPHLIRHHFATFNATSPRVLTLARGLAPAYLRFSGTDADRMVYTGNMTAGHKNVIPFPVAGFNMTSNDWDEINRCVTY